MIAKEYFFIFLLVVLGVIVADGLQKLIGTLFEKKPYGPPMMPTMPTMPMMPFVHHS
jgi:hypothetical protein